MQPLIVVAGLAQLGLMAFGIWVGLSHIKEMRRQSMFLSKIAERLEQSEGEG